MIIAGGRGWETGGKITLTSWLRQGSFKLKDYF
jgi:hypothetical protein